jgi:GDP-L-fucose synthase
LGTAGDFGTYSFYFSHHVTSGEGGMVVCKNEDDANFLRCLRAHGWTRHLTPEAKRKFHDENADIDSRFLFINLGYNLRPLECSAAMLQVQMGQLNKFNQNRRVNYNKVVKKLFGYSIEEQHDCESKPDGALDRTRGHVCANASKTSFNDTDATVYAGDVMRVMQPAPGTNPAWFGIAICLHRAFAHQLREFQDFLDQNGVENRPVISGNFLRQPCVTMYQDCVSSTSGPCQRAEDFPGADALHMRGFFIGVHQVPLSDAEVSKLCDIICSFKFKRKEVVLVTGGNGMLGRHIREITENAKWFGDVQHIVENAEWHFVCRKSHGDLRDKKVVESIFKQYQPTVVLHCAASLKSVMEMSAKPVQFWHDNVDVNNNLLSTAHKFQAWSGRTKVISVLSTVMFGFGGLKPQCELKEGEKVTDVVEYPLTADQALVGVPHISSESYGYAKRALLLTSEWYKKEFGCDFHTILPGNIYGEFGNFEAGTAPLVNALVSKAAMAAKQGGANLDVHGSGKPQRQIMYTRDLAKVMIWTVGLNFAQFGINKPLVVCGEEVPISKVAESVITAVKNNTQLAMLPSVNVDLKINYLGGNDGPERRTADCNEFLKLWRDTCKRDFEFTPFDQGCANSLNWFLANQ